MKAKQIGFQDLSNTEQKPTRKKVFAFAGATKKLLEILWRLQTNLPRKFVKSLRDMEVTNSLTERGKAVGRIYWKGLQTALHARVSVLISWCKILLLLDNIGNIKNGKRFH